MKRGRGRFLIFGVGNGGCNTVKGVISTFNSVLNNSLFPEQDSTPPVLPESLTLTQILNQIAEDRRESLKSFLNRTTFAVFDTTTSTVAEIVEGVRGERCDPNDVEALNTTLENGYRVETFCFGAGDFPNGTGGDVNAAKCAFKKALPEITKRLLGNTVEGEKNEETENEDNLFTPEAEKHTTTRLNPVHYEMIIVVTGLGGGTGTGATPLLLETLRKYANSQSDYNKPPIITVYTTPDAFKTELVEEAEEEIKRLSDAFIEYSNGKIERLILKTEDLEIPVIEAARFVDDLVVNLILGIMIILAVPGIYHLDLEDVKNVVWGATNPEDVSRKRMLVSIQKVDLSDPDFKERVAETVEDHNFSEFSEMGPQRVLVVYIHKNLTVRAKAEIEKSLFSALKFNPHTIIDRRRAPCKREILNIGEECYVIVLAGGLPCREKRGSGEGEITLEVGRADAGPLLWYSVASEVPA